MNDYEKNFNEARATISDIDKEIAVVFEKRILLPIKDITWQFCKICKTTMFFLIDMGKY